MTDLPPPEGLEELNLEVPIDYEDSDDYEYIDEDENYNVIESEGIDYEEYVLNNAIKRNMIYPQN